MTVDVNINGKEISFYMDEFLKQQIDYYIKNVTQDWDFTIIISGEGMVRVGKSVLAQQIAAYWVKRMKEVHSIEVHYTLKDNIVFTGQDLIKKGNMLGKYYKYSPLIFDEAGADLDSSKVMMTTTKEVKAYLRECGQHNLLNILVLPEFFDLPKGVALSRSDCLITVYHIPNQEGDFQRGYFNYYSRPSKKWLYINGKKLLNYQAAKYDFHGRFSNVYTVDEQEYRKAKYEALRVREVISNREEKYLEWVIFLLNYVKEIYGLSEAEISRILNKSKYKISFQWINKLLSKVKQYEEPEEELDKP